MASKAMQRAPFSCWSWHPPICWSKLIYFMSHLGVLNLYIFPYSWNYWKISRYSRNIRGAGCVYRCLWSLYIYQELLVAFGLYSVLCWAVAYLFSAVPNSALVCLGCHGLTDYLVGYGKHPVLLKWLQNMQTASPFGGLWEYSRITSRWFGLIDRLIDDIGHVSNVAIKSTFSNKCITNTTENVSSGGFNVHDQWEHHTTKHCQGTRRKTWTNEHCPNCSGEFPFIGPLIFHIINIRYNVIIIIVIILCDKVIMEWYPDQPVGLHFWTLQISGG